MANKAKWKGFTISEKISIAQVDAHTGTQTKMVLQLGHPVATLNKSVKTVKQFKEVMSCVDLSPSSKNLCNVHRWQN
jgi:hypothetical protein